MGDRWLRYLYRRRRSQLKRCKRAIIWAVPPRDLDRKDKAPDCARASVQWCIRRDREEMQADAGGKRPGATMARLLPAASPRFDQIGRSICELHITRSTANCASIVRATSARRTTRSTFGVRRGRTKSGNSGIPERWIAASARRGGCNSQRKRLLGNWGPACAAFSVLFWSVFRIRAIRSGDSCEAPPP